MISLQEESLVSLRDAVNLLPKSGSKRVHISTLFRWAREGVNGVVLETVHIGSRRYTSHEAIARFVRAVSSARSPQGAVEQVSERSKGRMTKTEETLRREGLS